MHEEHERCAFRPADVTGKRQPVGAGKVLPLEFGQAVRP
jgi:hypothetical protein